MRLKGRTALITGAAQGIGEAIARAFIQEGAFVILTDVKLDLGRALAKELGNKALFIPLDVSSEEEWIRAVKVIQEKKLQLDVLVNNAGITGFEGGSGSMDPENCSLELWHHVHAVNLD